MIIQHDYPDPNWKLAGEAWQHGTTVLRERLEALGFHVLIWENLKGKDFEPVLRKVAATIGHVYNSRFFFYYYGHGFPLGTDTAGDRTVPYLVPVDAPYPTTNESDFINIAYPIRRIQVWQDEIKGKHAFFALDACYSGEIAEEENKQRQKQSLGGNESHQQQRTAHLIESADREDHIILTAARKDETTLAKSNFAIVLAEAMDDSNEITRTGRNVVEYVKVKIGSSQHPQTSNFPTKTVARLFFA